MYNPITICSEILALAGQNNIVAAVAHFKSDKYTKHFTTKVQLIVMMAAIAKRWNSLREIETGLFTISNKMFHLGINTQPKRTTLAHANNTRDSRVFEEMCKTAIGNVSNQMNIQKKPTWKQAGFFMG